MTSRDTSDIQHYKDAYDKVKSGISLRRGAETYAINYVSLLRYIRKRDAANEDNAAENVGMGYVAHNRVFTVDQEHQLAKYLIQCRHIFRSFF